LYLSPMSSCCTGATLLGQWNRSNLGLGSTYTLKKSVTVPGVPAGAYHLALRTDAADAVYESSEANNQRTTPLTITAADLVATALTAPASAGAGKSVSVSWTVKNQGNGQTAGTWTDKVYISPNSSCCTGAISLGGWAQSPVVAPGSSYTR